MADNLKLAENVLEAVGGKENVNTVTHCMTRLRFLLKDDSLAKEEVINKIPGVIKTIKAGGQTQIVIGQGVDKVYDEVCKAGGFEKKEAVDENLDTPKEKLSVKSVLNNVMGAVSGSLVPVLPALIAAGIFKMVAVLFGPKNLGILTAENPLYIFCDLVNTATYYFLPFFIAYTAAKKFKSSPIYPMMLVAVMLHPTFLGIVDAGEPFRLYGFLPMPLVNYTNGVIPIVFSAYIISLVEKWVKKIMPDALRTIFIPVLTMLISYPLCLCIFGPICHIIMQYVAQAILWLNDNVGLLAIIIVAALWNIVVMFGMHMPIMMTLLPTWMQMGYDAIVSPGSIAAGLAGIGVELAYALRASTKEKRELGWSCLVTNVTANISEPALYGIMLVDKRALAYQMLGGAAGGLVMYLLGGKVTLFSGVGFPFLNFLRFGEYAVAGGIGMIVAAVVGFVLGFVLGFEKEEA